MYKNDVLIFNFCLNSFVSFLFSATFCDFCPGMVLILHFIKSVIPPPAKTFKHYWNVRFNTWLLNSQSKSSQKWLEMI